MKYDAIRSEWVMSSGKVLRAYGTTILGINNRGKPYCGENKWLDDDNLEQADKEELADYMIALWSKYKHAQKT